MKKIIHGLLVLMSTQITAVSAGTFHPFIDVLAWRAAETSSAWAETISPVLTTSNNVNQSYLSFNTRPGLKLGLTYQSDDNDIDSTFYWTNFSSGSSATIPFGDHIIASLFFSGSFFLSGGVFFGSYANWQLAMNMFDWDVSHSFKPVPTVTLTPKLGVKGGSINQNINIDWQSLTYTANEKVTNNFSGIGPSFGMNAKWNVLKELNVVGDVTTALMYGRWNNNDTYHRPAGLVTEQTIFTSMNQSKLGTLMMDYYVGLQWVHEGQSRVSLNLGYEMQYWAGQLRWLAVQQFPPLGDLTIQGATCGITIDL